MDRSITQPPGSPPQPSLHMLTRIFAITAALTTLAPSAAQAIPVPARTENLSAIVGRITQIQSVRVPVAHTVTGSETRVSLQFTLNGCLDTLLPVLSYSEVRGRRATIYVTALNAHNPDSARVRCVAIPQATAQVSVPGVFQPQQVRVVFLGVSPEEQVVRGGRTQ
ncbi:hypothetical protein H6F67_09895 [Microcoleus sp. FACHB-1515]|uniref:hypothetical protein n=1 Tax=Cyanophyceae TaxID=3028117 RepID=UPI00168664F7|nr:hypothetical protein [Microcoleus sp. FACHB-1515]MBD2090165.1 hypothetical protein [Microcoleus sp. FACHB-1515]